MWKVKLSYQFNSGSNRRELFEHNLAHVLARQTGIEMTQIGLSPLRKQYPAIQKKVHGQKRIFFDGAAGTQLPQQVLDAMMEYMIMSNANYGGYYRTSIETDEILVKVREDVADFINAPSWKEIVLGPNMTTLTYSMAWAL